MQGAMDVRARTVYYLLRLLGGRVSRTMLVKLLFLVDLAAARKGARPLFRWVRWHYGPFSREVLDVVEELADAGLVEERLDIDPYRLELRRAEYRALPARVEPPPEPLRSAVEEVVGEWGGRSLDEILSYVYRLPEVRGRRLGEVIELERRGG